MAQQNKKEYAPAAASYRILLDKHASSILADHAVVGLAECLVALGKRDEAVKVLQERRAGRPGQLRSDAATTIIQAMLRNEGK